MYTCARSGSAGGGVDGAGGIPRMWEIGYQTKRKQYGLGGERRCYKMEL